MRLNAEARLRTRLHAHLHCSLILDPGAQWALASMSDVEFMAFPRIAAVAEVAWSPSDSREWAELKARLGAQEPRWARLASMHIGRRRSGGGGRPCL